MALPFEKEAVELLIESKKLLAAVDAELSLEQLQFARDRQEALSARYVVGLRLLLLSSGHWALFQGGEQGLDGPIIMNQLDPEQLLTLGLMDLGARTEWAARQEAQRATAGQRPGPGAMPTRNLEDMGL